MFQSPLGEVVKETQSEQMDLILEVDGFNPLSGKW